MRNMTKIGVPRNSRRTSEFPEQQWQRLKHINDRVRGHITAKSELTDRILHNLLNLHTARNVENEHDILNCHKNELHSLKELMGIDGN